MKQKIEAQGAHSAGAIIAHQAQPSAAAAKLLDHVGRELLASRYEELFKAFEKHPARVAPFTNLSADQYTVESTGPNTLSVSAQPLVGDVWNHAHWKPIPDARISFTHEYRELDELMNQFAGAIRREFGWSRIDGAGVRKAIGQALAIAAVDELKGRYFEATKYVPEKGTSVGILGVETRGVGANELELSIRVGARDFRGVVDTEVKDAPVRTYVMNVRFANLIEVAELARFADGNGLVEGGLSSSRVKDVVELARRLVREAAIDGARGPGEPIAVELPDAKALQAASLPAVDGKSFARSTGVTNPQLIAHAKIDPAALKSLAAARTAFEIAPKDNRDVAWIASVTAPLSEVLRHAGEAPLARFIADVRHFFSGDNVAFMQKMLESVLAGAEALSKAPEAGRRAIGELLEKSIGNDHAGIALAAATRALLGEQHVFARTLEKQIDHAHGRFLVGGLYPDVSGIAAAIARIALAVGEDPKGQVREVVDAAKKELAREPRYREETIAASATFVALESLPEPSLAALMRELKQFRADDNAAYSRALVEPAIEAARFLARGPEVARLSLLEKLQNRQNSHQGLVFALAAETVLSKDNAGRGQLRAKLAAMPKFGGLNVAAINAAAEAALEALKLEAKPAKA